MIVADLHIHSNISDGSDSIDELIEKIKKSGLGIVALSDHDTIIGCMEMAKKLPENIKFINGIELTCTADTGLDSHILGLNCDIKNEALTKLILKGKLLRRKKTETRIKFLKDAWNINLTKAECEWLYSRETTVKTHFGIILVKRGLSDNLLEAMDKYFDGCKIENTRFDTKEAVETIVTSGGIPVWAHPLGGEGEKHISKDLFLKRLDEMIILGIQGLECYYSRYNTDEINMLLQIAKNKNLLISGGSDYHGENKSIIIGQLNTDNILVNKNELTLLNKIL